MKYDIVFAGVGGQGILSMTNMLIQAACDVGLQVKQTEIHGMAQRGGAVTSQVRIADSPIHSGIIAKGTAHYLVATEPMEALRQLDFLSEDGCVISSTDPVKNIAYPELIDIHNAIRKRRHYNLIDMQQILIKINNPKAANIVLLGALVNELQIAGLKDKIRRSIEGLFAHKGDAVVQANLLALS